MPTANGGTPKGEARALSKDDSGSAASKRIRPCQRCQKLKVKCERSTDGGPCQRCQAKKRECTFEEVPGKKRRKNPDEYTPATTLIDRDRRIDELEKTLAAMRESLASGNHRAISPHTGEQTGNFGASHGQPLDILARTAVSAHSPTLDRVTSGNTFPATSGTEPQTPNADPRASVSESSSAWSPDGNSFDPIERRWVDYEDAKSLFERCTYSLRMPNRLDSQP
jgi:Fungal Zn(2)-Cys(6) binuclear cluster domain